MFLDLHFSLINHDNATCESRKIFIAEILALIDSKIVGIHLNARNADINSRVGKDLPLVGAFLFFEKIKLV